MPKVVHWIPAILYPDDIVLSECGSVAFMCQLYRESNECWNCKLNHSWESRTNFKGAAFIFKLKIVLQVSLCSLLQAQKQVLVQW